MLTTIIYRSHICDNVSFKSIEAMVARANERNGQADVTGILLFNGTHFFQLIEGPEEKVQDIYQHICRDPRHYNLVELLCDYAPSRRFGKVGMELFDLREHDREEVLHVMATVRAPLYAEVADLHLDTDGCTPDQACRMLLPCIQNAWRGVAA